MSTWIGEPESSRTRDCLGRPAVAGAPSIAHVAPSCRCVRSEHEAQRHVNVLTHDVGGVCCTRACSQRKDRSHWQNSLTVTLWMAHPTDIAASSGTAMCERTRNSCRMQINSPLSADTSSVARWPFGGTAIASLEIPGLRRALTALAGLRRSDHFERTLPGAQWKIGACNDSNATQTPIPSIQYPRDSADNSRW